MSGGRRHQRIEEQSGVGVQQEQKSRFQVGDLIAAIEGFQGSALWREWRLPV